MGNNKMIFAGLAGGITLFLLGWLIYGMLLMDFMAANAGSATGVNKTEAEMSLLWIFIGNLSTGFLLAVIFGKYGNIKDAMAGAMAGALIGLLMSIGFDGILYGTTNIMNMRDKYTSATSTGPFISALLRWSSDSNLVSD